MKVAVLRETYPCERRVALIPAVLAALAKLGWQTVVETGAGDAAGYPDEPFREKGAEIASDRRTAVAAADAVVQVRALGANPQAGRGDLELFKPEQLVIATCDPLG